MFLFLNGVSFGLFNSFEGKMRRIDFRFYNAESIRVFVYSRGIYIDRY